MKSFKDFKIATKLYSGFGAVLVLLAIVAFMSYNNLMKTMDGFSSVIKDDIATELLNANIDRYMLEARRSEKDFLLRKDLKYVDKVKEAVTKLKAEAGTLLELAQKTGHQDNIEQVNAILDNADIYFAGFQDVVKAWEKRGLDHKSGLQGQFRNAAHELEAIFDNSSEDHLLADLLMIRRHEKDYLLRGLEKYVKETRSALATLQLDAMASGLSVDKKDALKVTADKYEKVFLALVEQDKEIASRIETMRGAIHKLEPIISDGYAAALERGTTRQKSNIRTANANAQIPVWI